MDLDRRAIAGVLSLLLCWGTGGNRNRQQWSVKLFKITVQLSPAITNSTTSGCSGLLLFFLEPSSISGLRVTITTLTIRLFPPCRIILTTCLWPTFTTFWPLTWDRNTGWLSLTILLPSKILRHRLTFVSTNEMEVKTNKLIKNDRETHFKWLFKILGF